MSDGLTDTDNDPRLKPGEPSKAKKAAELVIAERFIQALPPWVWERYTKYVEAVEDMENRKAYAERLLEGLGE